MRSYQEWPGGHAEAQREAGEAARVGGAGRILREGDAGAESHWQVVFFQAEKWEERCTGRRAHGV